MGQVGDLLRRVQRIGELPRLAERVAALEAEIQECRQVNLRLAELTDVVTELLLPVAARDQDRVDEVLERYRRSVGGPSA